MKVKLYPRVSSKKQANEGDSVESQDSELKKHSNENGDEIVEVITDAGKSASISDDKIKIWHNDGFVYAKIDIRKRIGMNKILDSLKLDDWDALKITKWDRFSRNNIFSQLMLIHFNNFNKKIIAIKDSNDSLVRDLLSVLGQEEIKKMKDRVRDVRKHRFEKGIMVGKAPVGYKFNKKKKIMAIDPKKVGMIKDVFFFAFEGKSYKEICDKWKLKPQSYYNIIKNKVYIGIIEFEGNERKGIHEPLVSQEIFEKCNKKPA